MTDSKNDYKLKCLKIKKEKASESEYSIKTISHWIEKCNSVTKELNEQLGLVAKLKRNSSKIHKKCKDFESAKEGLTKTFKEDKINLLTKKKLLKDVLQKRDTQIMELKAELSDLKDKMKTTAQKDLKMNASNFSFDHDDSNTRVKTEIKTETKY